MSETPEVDREAALDVLGQFSSAVFQKQLFPLAFSLFTADSRREWAVEWVVGELEAENLLMTWSERDDLVASLASIDTDHRLWDSFAADTLRLWRDLWRALPQALGGSGSVHLRRHRTDEEWRSMASQVTLTVNAPDRIGPPDFWVYFDESDYVLRIADING
jgi:hypothetical protein